MDAAELLHHLRSAGLTLALMPDGVLHVTPRSAISDEHRSAIRTARDALVAVLQAEAMQPTEAMREAIEERAAIMEYEGGLARIEAERLAALQPWPPPLTKSRGEAATATATSAWWLLHYPDREPPQLVSTPPATLAQILKQHPEALAAEPFEWPHPEPDLTRQADRSCWPHSRAMNSVEIDTFMGLLGRLTDKGLGYDEAEALVDKLLLRDREADDRRLCLECRHLHGWPSRWRCGNWQQADVAREGLARDLALLLQRCKGFVAWHAP